MIFQRLEEIEKKQLALNSIPRKMLIHSLELDLTWDCNLKCVYCYKGERRQTSISPKTAIDAIIWLFFASSHTKNISLFFMGGEPLLQFELIKSIVPFARRRAREQGKQLKISTTTNCTLVTHEVLDFFSSFDYQWNPHDFEFQKIIRNSNIDRIHDFLYRAFLWQRWVIQNTYQDHSDPEIVVNENTI